MNSVQQYLVNTDAKWVDVSAGPGSGKTEVIAQRIARLIREFKMFVVSLLTLCYDAV